jgi:hypothetical protein
MQVSVPQDTIGVAPISYRGALLRTLLHASLSPTRHNWRSTYQLQRSATEHSPTCKSHSQKPQQAQYLSVTEERYWALFYMQVSVPQGTTGVTPISYRGALLRTLLHASLSPTSGFKKLPELRCSRVIAIGHGCNLEWMNPSANRVQVS